MGEQHHVARAQVTIIQRRPKRREVSLFVGEGDELINNILAGGCPTCEGALRIRRLSEFRPRTRPGCLIGPAFAAPIELSQNYAPGISLVKATGFVQPRPKGLGATLRHQFRCWS